MSVKTLLWDIETGPYEAYVWGMWQQNIHADNITRDSQILSISWKYLDEKKVHGVVVGEGRTERYVIESFLYAAEGADLLVHFNGDKFDLKRLTARMMVHQLPPLHKVNTVDPLKEIKRVAKFPSHRMDYLSKLLCGIGKHETDMQLWRDCVARDEKSLARLLAYNKNDVKMLEALYLYTRPYYKSHVNVADIGSMNCPRCNSELARVRKAYRTKSGVERAHVHCLACSAPYTISPKGPNRPHSAV